MLGPILVSIFSIANFGREPVLLTWHPAVGDRCPYKLTIDGESAGMTIALDGSYTQTVTKIDDKAIVVSEEMSVMPRGVAQAAPGRLLTANLVLKHDGTVTEVDSEVAPEDHFRSSRLMELVLPAKPVSIGDSWVVETPPDDNASKTGVKMKYTLTGVEKIGSIDTYKIDCKGGETGDSEAKTVATFWIDKTTGNKIHFHVKITGAAFPGDKGRSVDLEEDYLKQP